MNTPNKRTKEIHGVDVQQIQLQGNYYTPVDGRVKIAEQADPSLVRRAGAGYHVVSVQIMPVGDRWAYHCMVEYPAGSGVVTPGTDFIDLKDNAGIAKAETSAIGRALGLHGIAIEESIASAEEMSRVVRAEEYGRQRTPQPQQVAQTNNTTADDASTRAEGTPAPAHRVSTQDTQGATTAHEKAAGHTSGQASDALETTNASADEQKRLVVSLREHGYDTLASAQSFLNDSAPRVDAAALRTGTASISLRELATIHQRLTRTATTATTATPVTAEHSNGKAARP